MDEQVVHAFAGTVTGDAGQQSGAFELVTLAIWGVGWTGAGVWWQRCAQGRERVWAGVGVQEQVLDARIINLQATTSATNLGPLVS